MFVLLLGMGANGCNSFRRLDEVFSVQCRSAGTAGFKEKRDQDKGWNRIMTGGAIGTKSAEDVVDHWRKYFIFLDDDTLAVTHAGLRLTFDACATFSGWYPTLVPIELVDVMEKPSYCAPEGGGDCRHYDFQGDREAKIEELKIAKDGTVSFLARTAAVG